MKRLILGAALAALTGCAQPAALPKGPMAAGPGITITAVPVPLNPQDAKQDRIGDFVYAGGLQLSSDQTARLHGLSDLRVTADGKLSAHFEHTVLVTDGEAEILTCPERTP